MTVKEVFELRKQGKIEEAYETIRPMYAVHQGKYTTLCMFWTASDILKKRVKEQRLDEAEKIFKALLRILPRIDDQDGRARSSILHEAILLDKESKTFRMLDFVEQLKVDQLSDDDWKNITPMPKADSSAKDEGETSSSQVNRYTIPSVAQQLLTCAFHEIQEEPTADNALKVMPLLQEAVRRHPHDKNNQRYMAIIYRIMGQREKAVDIYRQLLTRYHDSYLYAELAELTNEPGQKAALLCSAIKNQRQEQFCSGYRLDLARLLMDRDKPKAAYELQKCIATRQSQGFHPTREMQQMLSQLNGVQPSTDTEQRTFYQQIIAKYPH